MVQGVEPEGNKVMRLQAQTALMENGFVSVPKEAPWLALYLHELTTFPKGTYDDQADSTAQALAWIKQSLTTPEPGIFRYYRERAEQQERERRGQPPARASFPWFRPQSPTIPSPIMDHYREVQAAMQAPCAACGQAIKLGTTVMEQGERRYHLACAPS